MIDRRKRSDSIVKLLTHEELLKESGFDIVSPISGSMYPMIRPRRDSVLFVPPGNRLKRLDVALYRSDGYLIMHRVIGVRKDGYVIRGDNAREKEYILDEQVIGVMHGFYRDETFIPCEERKYRWYSRLIVAAHPVMPAVKWLRRLLRKGWQFARRIWIQTRK